MHTIEKLFSKLNPLDMYTQLSVLGSWAFTANSACINAAMRYIPDAPVDNGIETFTQYEAGRRKAIGEADDSNLPALLALQNDICNAISELGGEVRDVSDTYAFMTSNTPTREQFERDYETRRRAGMRPAMTLKQFVDFEMERAMAQHNKLVARGEDAVRLCQTTQFSSNRGYGDLPDWVAETFERKFVDKLQARWLKLDLVRSDPRRQAKIRDDAEADQLLIAQALEEYGVTFSVPAEAEPPKDDMPNDKLDDKLPIRSARVLVPA